MDRELPANLFSGLLAIAADAVIALDHEQRIIFFNEGAERIFGWSATEVVGHYLEILLPERFRAAHRGHIAGFGAAHGRARLMGERQEISGLRKSGEEFAAEAAIQRISVDDHDIYAAVLRDVSARNRAEHALRQALEARDEMMGIVSHDLRNPANAVKMLARSILEGDASEVSASVMERVAVIRLAADQIDTLIQDLLDITRLEGGRLVVDAAPVELAALVRGSLAALRPLAEASAVRLSSDVPESVMVLADAERVIQLLSNLIGNAIKFTPTDGAVYLSATLHDAEVEFVVNDTGCGIAPDQLPRVFDHFYQGKSSGRRGSRHGAGLGLPIAKGIVEAHGGQIAIESAPGAGTTVRFTLPRALAVG